MNAETVSTSQIKSEVSKSVDGPNEKTQLLLAQGKKKVLEKDYTKAIEYFSKALEADKQNFDAMFYRAISLLDSGLI